MTSEAAITRPQLVGFLLWLALAVFWFVFLADDFGVIYRYG